MKILIAIILIFCNACSTMTIKVVDDNGMPVKGALVITEKPPLILLDHSSKLAAYLTDENGKALIVSNIVHIFKDSFYPVIGSSELESDRLWFASSMFKPEMKIYPIRIPNTEKVEVRPFVVVQKKNKSIYKIPIKICFDITVTYDLENSKFVASTDVGYMVPSGRFYFEKGIDQKVSQVLERRENLAFYCKESNHFHKVGMATYFKMWKKGIGHHGIKIFEAPKIALETYLEPKVKCATEENLFIINRQHKVLSSNNLKSQISSLRNKIPCHNKRIGNLLNYIDGLL